MYILFVFNFLLNPHPLGSWASIFVPSFLSFSFLCWFQFSFARIKVSDFWINYFLSKYLLWLIKTQAKINTMDHGYTEFATRISYIMSPRKLYLDYLFTKFKILVNAILKELLAIKTSFFKYEILVAFYANLKRFQWNFSVKNPREIRRFVKWLQRLVSSIRR